jgi:hypothetical protein
VVATGDFNGDGRDDILWRNDDGTIGNWLGGADGSFTVNNDSLVGVTLDWQIASIGDYNGDGRDDVLWRNTNGTIVDWLGQTDGTFADNSANSTYAVPNSWHVQDPSIMGL